MGIPKYKRKPHTSEVKIGEAFPFDGRIEVAMASPYSALPIQGWSCCNL